MTEEIFPCWCGNSRLELFSKDYNLCPVCSSLVVKQAPGSDLTKVHDQGELYSRDYYLTHMPQEGYPDLATRTRNDLPERDTYWLRALLKYSLPIGKTLEVGCAHGGFVALLKWAGFDASGLELSPWLVNYAGETFGIPVLQGPLEQQAIAPASLDVLIFMDVLEHLANPADTMQRALQLLSPRGFLLVQTPCYPDGVSYDDLVAHNDHFLEMLLPMEHLYLFSQRAARNLFSQLGAPQIAFEPPIFDYDMFFLVSRQPLKTYSQEQRDVVLQVTSSGRFILALLDLYDRAEMFQVAAYERLRVIEGLKAASESRSGLVDKLKKVRRLWKK